MPQCLINGELLISVHAVDDAETVARLISQIPEALTAVLRNSSEARLISVRDQLEVTNADAGLCAPWQIISRKYEPVDVSALNRMKIGRKIANMA